MSDGLASRDEQGRLAIAEPGDTIEFAQLEGDDLWEAVREPGRIEYQYVDQELPGMWEAADLIGGLEEVRGPDWTPDRGV